MQGRQYDGVSQDDCPPLLIYTAELKKKKPGADLSRADER